MRRALTGAAVAVACLVAAPARTASAHPLGNFTINQYSSVQIHADGVTIDLVIDEAEIPAFQARGDIDTDHDDTVDETERVHWHTSQCASAAAHNTLTLDGQALNVRPDAGGELTFPPGQAGLLTLRLECVLRADVAVAAGEHTLAYHNTMFDGRIGWHEIVVPASGVTLLASDVPATSTSDRLTHYPTEQLRSPLDQRSATVRFSLIGAAPGAATARPAPASAARALLPRRADRATRAFTDLVAHRNLTFAFALAALGLAVVLGSLHALAPGHGKTVMAAYIVGQRGSKRQAALIGLTVTATHTAGVVVLGIILTTSSVLAPERLYPWLGLASGLLLAGIGVTLIRRTRLHGVGTDKAVSRDDHDHEATTEPILIGAHDHGYGEVHNHPHSDDHAHDHGHAHNHPHSDDHAHDHGHAHDPGHGHSSATTHSHGGWTHSHPTLDPACGWRSLIAVGLAGGMVPSPSALLVLVGAIALGRTWFGLLLVTAYGVGMAAMLTVAGLLLAHARSFLDRRAERGRRSAHLTAIMRLVPLATSTAIVIVGLALALRSVMKI